MYKNKLTYAVVLSGLIISACSTQHIPARDSLQYLQSSRANPLEYPPDLVKQTATDRRATNVLSEYRRQTARAATSNVLPTDSITRMESSGDRRWVNTGHSPDFVWTRVNQLLLELGLEVESSSPEAGLIETKWAENRADVPDGFIRRMLKTAFKNVFSAPTRDKFKIRLERDGQRTLVYVTHYGMQDHTSGNDDQYHRWVDRPSDPELEAEFVARLVAKLGGDGGHVSGAAGGLPVVERQGTSLIVNRNERDLFIQVGNILDDGAVFNVLEQFSADNRYRVGRVTKKRRFLFGKSYDREGELYNVQVTSLGGGESRIDVTPVTTGQYLEELFGRLQTQIR